jgi:hypothetical protein
LPQHDASSERASPPDDPDQHHDDRDHEQDVDEAPIVYELVRPRAQSTMRMIAIVHSMLSLYRVAMFAKRNRAIISKAPQGTHPRVGYRAG